MSTTSSHPIPVLSEQAKAFRPGVYQHYKGDLYDALCVARMSEDREQEVVVYRSQKFGYTWVRPLQMFLEEVEVDGEKMPRFRLMEEA